MSVTWTIIGFWCWMLTKELVTICKVWWGRVWPIWCRPLLWNLLAIWLPAKEGVSVVAMAFNISKGIVARWHFCPSQERRKHHGEYQHVQIPSNSNRDPNIEHAKQNPTKTMPISTCAKDIGIILLTSNMKHQLR